MKKGNSGGGQAVADASAAGGVGVPMTESSGGVKFELVGVPECMEKPEDLANSME